MKTKCAIAVLGLCLVGCGVSTLVLVESDTSWSGSFQSEEVKGQGDQTIDVHIVDGTRCQVAARKETDNGYLRVRVVQQDITGNQRTVADTVTREAYGYVRIR